MSRYIALRFLQAIISLLVVMTIVFMLSRLSGDPVQLLADISASEEQMEAIREDLGLNRPLAVQWVTYVPGYVRLQPGRISDKSSAGAGADHASDCPTRCSWGSPQWPSAS